MIRCPRCGQPVAADATACPRCGERLAPAPMQQMQQMQQMPPQGPNFGASTTDMGMPDWLRSLQAQQQQQAQQQAQPLMQGAYNAPYPPNGANQGGQWPGQYGQQGYPQQPIYGGQPQLATGSVSLGDMISEENLPDWIRNAADTGSWRVQPAPQLAQPQPQPQQMAGWQGQQQYPQQYQQPYQQAPQQPQMQAYQPPPQQPQYPQQPQQMASNAFPSLDASGRLGAPGASVGMPAQALLDAGSLPAWMGGPPASAAGNGQGYGQNAGQNGQSYGMQASSLIDDNALPQWLRDSRDTSRQPATTQAPDGAVSRWITGSAAEEPLPSWMNQVYAGAARMAPEATATAGVYSPVGQQVGVGMAASQLVEESVLPDWLKAQGALPASSSPAPMAYAGANSTNLGVAPASSGGASFSASDLIDPSSLPAWVSGAQAPETSFSSSRGWTVKQPAPQAGAQSSAGMAPVRDVTGRVPRPNIASRGAPRGEPTAAEWDAASRNDDAARQLQAGQQGAGYGDGASGSWYEEAPTRRQPGAMQSAQNSQTLRRDELPPWLQTGAPAADPRGGYGQRGQMMGPLPGEDWGDGGGGADFGWGDDADPYAQGGYQDADGAYGYDDGYNGSGGGYDGYNGYNGADGYDGYDYDPAAGMRYEKPQEQQRKRGWLGFLRRG